MKYRIEINTQEWAGKLSRRPWRPAIAGTLNQTGMTDEEASTYDTLTEAEVDVPVVREQLGDAEGEVRIVEVE